MYHRCRARCVVVAPCWTLSLHRPRNRQRKNRCQEQLFGDVHLKILPAYSDAHGPRSDAIYNSSCAETSNLIQVKKGTLKLVPLWSRGGWLIARLFPSGRLKNQGRDRVGLRNQGEVACLYLDCSRTHALSHKSLQVGIYRSIFRRNRIEARLGTPRDVLGLTGQKCLVKWLLNRIEHPCWPRARDMINLSQFARKISSAP